VTRSNSGNDVSQCGLGKDAVSFVEEPTLVASLTHVHSPSPPPFHSFLSLLDRPT
jgi:hypothetical protein